MRVPKITWSRVLAEGAVIVVSILLAFAIDALWEQRQDRRAELSYLRALLVDVADVAAEAERTITANERIDDEARSRIRVLEAIAGVPDSIYDISRAWAGSTYRLRANLDVYADLLSSGGITTLTSPGVRQAMAVLQAEMDHEQLVMSAFLEMTGGLAPMLVAARAAGSADLNRMVRLTEAEAISYRSVHTDRKRDVLAAATAARAAIESAIAEH